MNDWPVAWLQLCELPMGCWPRVMRYASTSSLHCHSINILVGVMMWTVPFPLPISFMTIRHLEHRLDCSSQRAIKLAGCEHYYCLHSTPTNECESVAHIWWTWNLCNMSVYEKVEYTDQSLRNLRGYQTTACAVFIAGRNFVNWKFWASMLASWVCLFVCCVVRFRITDHSSTAAFTKLYTEVGTGPGKNCLYFQGHWVEGQGHASMTKEMLSTQ